MGFFSKLAFWKKKDDLDNLGKDLGLDKELGLDLGAGPSPDLGMGIEPAQQQPYQKYPSFQQSGFQPQPSFQSQAFQQPSYQSDSYIASKNLEVISSKLDALRASLESINQRLANIEAIARGEQEDTRRKRYY
ncbi:hypothetical protein J4448_01925 [Candidatus Woesearchaeota archaeon]|nr:hypothetical protein [Candidatus Woesearchaeota archaeon]